MIAIIGGALIIFVLAAVSKQYQYKKYENPSAGFSIKYPAAWTYKENQFGANVIFLSPLENKLDVIQENVNIVVQNLEKKTTLNQYTEIAILQLRAVFKENVQILESGPDYFMGMPAFKIVYLGKGPEYDFKYMHIWTINGPKAYQLTYVALPSTYDKYWGKIQKMINSFQAL